MNNGLKIIISILLLIVMPVLSAYIIVKLFVNGKGTILAIIFFSLIVLGVIAEIIRFVRSRKNE